MTVPLTESLYEDTERVTEGTMTIINHDVTSLRRALLCLKRNQNQSGTVGTGRELFLTRKSLNRGRGIRGNGSSTLVNVIYDVATTGWVPLVPLVQ